MFKPEARGIKNLYYPQFVKWINEMEIKYHNSEKDESEEQESHDDLSHLKESHEQSSAQEVHKQESEHMSSKHEGVDHEYNRRDFESSEHNESHHSKKFSKQQHKEDRTKNVQVVSDHQSEDNIEESEDKEIDEIPSPEQKEMSALKALEVLADVMKSQNLSLKSLFYSEKMLKELEDPDGDIVEYEYIPQKNLLNKLQVLEITLSNKDTENLLSYLSNHVIQGSILLSDLESLLSQFGIPEDEPSEIAHYLSDKEIHRNVEMSKYSENKDSDHEHNQSEQSNHLDNEDLFPQLENQPEELQQEDISNNEDLHKDESEKHSSRKDISHQDDFLDEQSKGDDENQEYERYQQRKGDSYHEDEVERSHHSSHENNDIFEKVKEVDKVSEKQEKVVPHQLQKQLSEVPSDTSPKKGVSKPLDLSNLSPMAIKILVDLTNYVSSSKSNIFQDYVYMQMIHSKGAQRSVYVINSADFFEAIATYISQPGTYLHSILNNDRSIEESEAQVLESAKTEIQKLL